jgi:hypothetical protein
MARFFAALLVAIAFALIDPALLLFVGFGAGLTIIPVIERGIRRLRKWSRSMPQPRRRVIALSIFSAACVGFLFGWSLMGLPSGERVLPLTAPTIELPAQFDVIVDYQLDDRWGVTEELTVLRRTLTAAARSSERKGLIPKPTGRQLAQEIKSGLRESGWALTIDSNLRQRYRRHREQKVRRSAVVPAIRTNKIDVPGLALFVSSGYLMSFPRLEKSRVSISAPQRSVAHTFPSASLEQLRPSDKRQVLTLPLHEDVEAIELDIRSPPFRNEVLARASDLTFWAPFGWLLTAMIALANEAFRDLLKRLFGVAQREGSADS